jgi:hypothetical protein
MSAATSEPRTRYPGRYLVLSGIGARARVPVGHDLELDPEAALEDVERWSFVLGARRINAVFRAVLVWRPSPGAATFGGR